ncbi:hypothetical protein A1O3_05250 [Capronia epimyces CBS 606.96]|uniref:Uncharacterized protein n=1 Tax=Capronia epimyces CBS 606.96 TaxID=1182542 RepID=W9Y4K8_9EURO|nr:uncharacterized protein A1O3_05250 [Capronia epimyces CBS 606.96]EXJ84580.1 hypothetical protein A1O3_05250 [Capronia epimyces CBS 606.96]
MSSSRKRSARAVCLDHGFGTNVKQKKPRTRSVSPSPPPSEEVSQFPSSPDHPPSGDTPDQRDASDSVTPASTAAESLVSHGIELDSVTSCTSSQPAKQEPNLEVCYGTIYGVHVAPLKRRNRSTDSNISFNNPDKPWRVRFRSGAVILINDVLDEVAHLDMHHSPILTRLRQKVPMLRCDVYTIQDKDIKPRRPKNSSHQVLEGVVNVYGDESQADIVATELDKDGIFLQEPSHLDKAILYVNPQVYTVDENNTTPLFMQQDHDKQRDFEGRIAAIINERITFDQDHDFVQDRRIISTLKPYVTFGSHSGHG